MTSDGTHFGMPLPGQLEFEMIAAGKKVEPPKVEPDAEGILLEIRSYQFLVNGQSRGYHQQRLIT